MKKGPLNGLKWVCALVLIAGAARATEALRLYEIGAVRFVEHAPGETWLERGRLSALGQFTKTAESPVLASVNVPDEAKDRTLVSLDAWYAYAQLGGEAVANFSIDEDAVPFTIGLKPYTPVVQRADANLDVGIVTNLSTRGVVTPTNKLIAGFVITENYRRVLIRAVGPGLGGMGVTGAMADPYVTLFRGTMPIYFNGNWSERPDAAEIKQVAEQVGAFPLAAGSKDAALLVELPPGVYTAHVEAESGGGGEALVEVYRLP